MAYQKTDKYHKTERYQKAEKYETPLKKKRWSPFEAGIKEFDFKDVRTLSRFTTERGKILPRRITGLTAQHQREITSAIKRARQMSLLPFISYGYN